MTAWAHLSNAKHIDQMLADIPKWAKASDAVQDAARGIARGAAWSTAQDAAWYAAWDAARRAIQDTARVEAWYAVWCTARDAAWGAARSAARGAATALIAYDNCAPLLNYSVQELRALIALTESPAAVLLLPRAILEEAT